MRVVWCLVVALWFQVAIVKPGRPFHIVVDETSKRKVPAMVAFDGDDRMIGSPAQGVVRIHSFRFGWFNRTSATDNLSRRIVL